MLDGVGEGGAGVFLCSKTAKILFIIAISGAVSSSSKRNPNTARFLVCVELGGVDGVDKTLCDSDYSSS